MRASNQGLEFLRKQEGASARMYKDVGGYPTIGVGHLLTPNERRTGIIRIKNQSHRWEDGLTDQQIIDLLAQDVVNFEDAINHSVTAPINQQQFDALLSLAFNIGVTAFKNSTLVKKLNDRDYIGAQEQFHVWRKVGDKVITGLVNRREREAAMFGMVPEGEEVMVRIPIQLVHELIDAVNGLDDAKAKVDAILDKLGNILTQ